MEKSYFNSNQLDVLNNGSRYELTKMFMSLSHEGQLEMLKWADENGSYDDEEQLAMGNKPLTNDEKFDIFLSIFIVFNE